MQLPILDGVWEQRLGGKVFYQIFVRMNSCFAQDIMPRENAVELFHMELSVPTSAMAAQLCRAFRKDGPSIYADLIKRLTENDPKED